MEGLQVSLAGADDKLTQITASRRRTADAVQLGVPAFPRHRRALTNRRPDAEENHVTILDEALRACASGVLTAEAAVSLLIDCAGWLHRDDFTSSFITTGTSISDGTTLIASIDWDAAITALDGGLLPCSSGERHMLRLAASIAAGVPVNLSDALTGIDHRNARLPTTAVLRANGQ